MLFACLFSMACNCTVEKTGNDAPENTDPPVVTEPDAMAYVTTADKSMLFQAVPVQFGKPASMSPYVVELDPSQKYQTVDGFGAAITGSTCYNLLKMSQEDRTAFLKEIFDMEEGLGSSLVRVSIGASDFSLEEYTWCDKEGIENFAPHDYDRRDLFPILKEIYAINPDVKIIGSPWSAPRWMKRGVKNDDNYYSWTSGRLKPSCYQDYAEYFVKWIQTMEKEGFDIYAVTIQNEPLNHGNSMSMYMPWQEQRDFIKTALGPAFKTAGIDTKILLFDHNYNYDNLEDQKGYPLNILADPEAASYVAGSAWHNYGGDVSELDNIAKGAPDKEIYFTEASIGTWNYSFDKCLITDFRSIFLETLSRGNKGVTLWNLMLDENGAPNRPGGCQTCFGAVTIASSDYKNIERKSHYYNIAHASKVIKPGAVRIGTSGFSDSGIYYQAYQNRDGSFGVIILNDNSSAQPLVFVSSAHSVKYDVPGKSLVSLEWKD